ncbi:MAG: hypothetical protein ABL977_14460, partial [Candidatus Eisenbacteria bacterium]
MSPLRIEAGEYTARIAQRLEALRADDFHRRLLALDDSLWGQDPVRRRVVGNRLGWVNAPRAMRDRAAEFRAFADEATQQGFT